MKKGFTLIEMLVVIGIIAILVGASLASFSKMMKSAEKAKTQELVSEAATALTGLYEKEGAWPKKIREEGKTDGRLKKEVARILAVKKYMSLSLKKEKDKQVLAGKDRFGVITPWAAKVVDRKGTSAAENDPVGDGATVGDHILYYAVDLDGDGKIEGAKVGGESVDIRATAAVWCIGKSGGNKGKPWPYSEGLRKDDVYSWTKGQATEVK